MSSAPVAESQASGPNAPSIPADPTRSSLGAFLASKDAAGENLCVQAWPDPSTPVGRNTMGLWFLAIPVVALLLIKALLGVPGGFLGWLQIIIVSVGFAFIGGALMEWGLSERGEMNDQAKVFLAIGIAMILGLLLLRIGLLVGKTTGRKSGGGGGGTRMIMVPASAGDD